MRKIKKKADDRFILETIQMAIDWCQAIPFDDVKVELLSRLITVQNDIRNRLRKDSYDKNS